MYEKSTLRNPNFQHPRNSQKFVTEKTVPSSLKIGRSEKYKKYLSDHFLEQEDSILICTLWEARKRNPDARKIIFLFKMCVVLGKREEQDGKGEGSIAPNIYTRDRSSTCQKLVCKGTPPSYGYADQEM